jgi:acetoin utilization deacetylase AcuC-like enzyme
MKKVAWITDRFYLEHDTVGYPESPERLESINYRIEPLLDKLIVVEPHAVKVEDLEMIHSKEMIYEIKEKASLGLPIDSDTVLTKQSYHVALKAVGAGFDAIDGVKDNKFERAFCAVRPPGHHATPTKSMGFCIFNNIALSAKYAQKQGYEKVMIIDFDVHHGNGTQDAFYDDNSVFCFSTQQLNAYPKTGNESDRGVGKGLGYTSNHQLPANSTDAEILDIYENDLPKAYNFFQPDIILVSAGYDIHESDPLAKLDITTDGIRKIVRNILDLGDKPVIFFLEGGYSIDDLGINVLATVEEMLE